MSTDYRENCRIEFQVLPRTKSVLGELFLDSDNDEPTRTADDFTISSVDGRSMELDAVALVDAWNTDAVRRFHSEGWDDIDLPAIILVGEVWPHPWYANTYTVDAHVLFDFLEAL